MGKILEIKNLSKSYNSFNLDDVNFSLEEGYIMGFIGPNGAGKTTRFWFKFESILIILENKSAFYRY